MGNFKKVTEEIFYTEDFEIKNYLDPKTYWGYRGNCDDYNMMLQESVIGCESPIEQMLSIELERANISRIEEYNPFITVSPIYKNYNIECEDAKYRVDFMFMVGYVNQGEKGLNEVVKFVIECDGHEFHQKTKEQVEYDNCRQRALQKAGYEVIRFSGTEIWHKPYKCALEVKNLILSKCKYIKSCEVKTNGEI